MADRGRCLRQALAGRPGRAGVPPSRGCRHRQPAARRSPATPRLGDEPAHLRPLTSVSAEDGPCSAGRGQTGPRYGPGRLHDRPPPVGTGRTETLARLRLPAPVRAGPFRPATPDWVVRSRSLDMMHPPEPPSVPLVTNLCDEVRMPIRIRTIITQSRRTGLIARSSLLCRYYKWVLGAVEAEVPVRRRPDSVGPSTESYLLPGD